MPVTNRPTPSRWTQWIAQESANPSVPLPWTHQRRAIQNRLRTSRSVRVDALPL